MSSQAAPDAAAAAPARACAEPPVYKRHNLMMFIVLVGVFMSVLDGIVVNIALPTITTHFGTELAKSQWTITAYLLTTTSTLMIFGKISERTGRAMLFMTGFTIFVIGSFACGSSASLEQLVSFRVLQALGASMVFSISSAMLFEIAPRRSRGRAMGYLGTTVAVGSIAGPALGGFIVDALGWSYIFLINVPIGVLLLVLAAKYMKLNETRSPRLDMDWIGAGSLVLPGCRRIGKGLIVGAGSVVTRDVPEYTIVAGNPARAIRQRTLTHDPAGEAKLSLPSGVWLR